jgi:two-component system sensor histidine kinase/response regulator
MLDRLTMSVDAAAASNSQVRGRVLLAEDDETNQLYATSLLTREGWTVDVARTGHEAVALGSAGDYDLILMDCQMPELGGFEAVRELRRLEGTSRHTPIIALTAHDSKADREECAAAGMDAYVMKPFDVDTLRVALDASSAPRLRSIPTSSSSGPIDHGPLVDASRLGALPEAVAARLVEMFVSSSRQRVAELAAAERAGDIATAQKLTHTLRGSSATIGATQMAAVCAELGAALRSGDAEAIAARQADLETAFALTEPALRSPNGETSNGYSDPR